ncbi:malate dehydrogenase [Desulfocicer niacini]
MKITVIGAAGCVGSCAAFYIAAKGLVSDMVLLGGKRQNVLKQHAMDLSTAVSCQDISVYAGQFSDMTGSDIVINCAGASQGIIADRMEMLLKNVGIIQNISHEIMTYCPDAIVITASNPPGPLNVATHMASGINRMKLIGYSTNDSFRFREMLAKEFNVKVSQMEGLVIDEHGSTQVLLFSSARIDGKPVAITEMIKQKIRGEVPHILRRFEELKSGRTAGWTCAIGLAEIVAAIAGDTKETIPVSVILEGEYGHRGLSMTVPAIIGKGGIQKILEYELATDEMEGLKITTDALKAAIDKVKAAF